MLPPSKLKHALIEVNLPNRRKQMVQSMGVIKKDGYFYQVVPSDRKTLALYVYPDKRIVLRTPRTCSRIALHRFLDSKKEWIDKKLKERIELPSNSRIVEGRFFYLLGRKYKIKIIESKREEIAALKSSVLTIFSRRQDEEKYNTCLFETWLRKKAREVFMSRIDICYKRFPLPYHRKPTLRVKKIKSRWGSLSSKGNMNLSLDLIRFPLSCIDFVITHELCHLEQMNHGRKFYTLFDSVMPEHRQIKKSMKTWAKKVY